MLVHPTFAPLHAHLTGMEPEMAQVGGHRLAALYPVEVTSYAPFLTDFYSDFDGDVTERIVSSYVALEAHVAEVESFALSYYDDVAWRSYIRFVEAEIEQKVSPFALDLNRLVSGDDECGHELKQQLNILLRFMRLSSNLPNSTYDLLSEAELNRFSTSVAHLTHFFRSPWQVAA